ncbi:protein-lysine N-methyltransferase EEF2KMT-like isoform X2 [Macrobrachium nipponense]|uniref:protein-lysine N-methyltransferase EEF2KMT-like isoform X2 n=1 Tax=Macrobrachium nipponense TaxID=159736 RepID=UPI0030C7BE9D
MTAMTEEIQKLSKRFLKMYPVKDIDLKLMMNNLSKLDYDDSMEYQEKLLRSTIHHPIVQKYPPTILYRQRFLKRLITEIEDINLEVIDSLYKAYTNLLSQENRNTENSGSISYCYKTYCLAPELTITLKETQNIISEGTTGMFTWQASHVLADWCQKEADSFSGKNVLELGAGLGLTGLTVIKACNPASYTFTDLHMSVLKTLKENILINLCNGSSPESTNEPSDGFSIPYKDTRVSVKRLDWTSDHVQSSCDIVLAAEALGKSDGATAYVASTIRNQDTFNCFRNALVSNNVKVKSESHHAYQESPSQQKSFIIIMKLML